MKNAFLMFALASGCYAGDYSSYSVIDEKMNYPTITATIAKEGTCFTAEYHFITGDRLEDRMVLSKNNEATSVLGLVKFVVRDFEADGTIDVIELDDKITFMKNVNEWSVTTRQEFDKKDIGKFVAYSQDRYNIIRKVLRVEERRKDGMRLPLAEELPY